jgi:PAS domain S-box-containing protein
MNLKNIKIATQLRLSFAAMFLFVIILGAIAYWQAGKIHLQTETMYNHPLKTRRTLESLSSSVLNMRMNIRDFLLVEDAGTRQKILNEIAVNQSNVLSEIEKLKDYYLGPREDIEVLSNEFTKWVSIRQETIRLVNAGIIEEARLRHLPGGIAPSQAQKVLGALKKISDFAHNKGDQLYANSVKLNKSLNNRLISLVAIILLLSLIVNYFLLRNIRKPLNELTDATRRFHEGDMDARSLYEPKNEYGILSNSFNVLAESIQSNLALNDKVVSLAALMLSKYEVKEFFQETVGSLATHTYSQMAAIYLLSDDKKTFDHFESIGIDENARQTFAANSFEGEFGPVLSSHKVQHIKNISDDTRFIFNTVSGKFIPREIITIPILTNNEVVAIISLASINEYGKETVQLIDKILVTLNARIEGILAYHKMRQFSEMLEMQKSELAKASNYNRGLIEASIDPLVTIGPDGKITDVNSSTEAVTGRTREELIGTDFANYFTDPKQAKAGYQQVFHDGFVLDYELTILSTSGKETPVLYNASVYRGEEGKVIGIFAAARDITERKLAEQEQFRLNQELSLRTEKLTLANTELESQKTELASQSAELSVQNMELEMQKKQLGEANRLKTNFLSNMSHELRTPLNSVIALSGVLNRRLVNQIPQEEYSYLEVIERNGKHLLELINDILDISRIEAGREEMEITSFNVNNIITDVVSMIFPQAKHKNIDLLNSATEDGISVISDSGKCRHILQNLIGNAVKFTEKGKVEVTAIKIDNNIVIKVTDTGIGIAENHIGHIFDEFRQADGSTSRRFGGSGLGLAIAKKYANLLGGNISVKSTPGEGSEFTLTLPIRYQSATGTIEIETEKTTPFSRSIKKPIVINTSHASAKTILLVEDSEPAIIQIQDFLEEIGYQILVARDGGEALSIISNTIPDAIILDLMMPVVDGFEVLKIVREAELTAHIPVLILTAKQISKEELKFLKRNNIHQLIQKGDVNRSELQNAVATMVTPDEVEIDIPQRLLQTIEGKPVVLVVEDNPDNMITVKAILADNYTVFGAVNGSEAIELAEKHQPNLILMDIELPGMDGIEAFKTIRIKPEMQHVPVIALTASAMTSDREAILAHGFDAYIAKPIDAPAFFKTINEILYGK